MTATTSAIRQAVTRIKRTWAELDYAQRRLMEIRTGVELTRPRERSRQATAGQLEEMYALEQERLAA